MAKQLLFEDAVRQALRRGVEKAARAIKETYGPRGRNVMLDQGWGSPKIVRDGAEVSGEIELVDKYENLGANLIKQAASKTNDDTGDGSTTTSILAETIFLSGLKHLSAGVDGMVISRGLRKAVDYVIDELKKMSQPTVSNDQILQIATIAANNDGQIGKILADALQKVSKDGVITIEEGKGIETEVKIVEGMQFDRGYISPYFITDQENMRIELADPYILIYEDKLASAVELIPLMEKIAQAKKPLFIIADEVEGDALATLVVNKTKGIISCGAVKAPGYGDRRKEMLEDIAIMTKGEAIFKDMGIDIKKLDLAKLGRAKKIVVDSENTTLVEGAGKPSEINSRIEQIRREIAKTDSDYDREKLQERLARLSGGVAQVNIGAATESELKDKKARAESALHAVKAASEEGFIPGGGVSFLSLARKLDEFKLAGDEQIGVDILKRSLEAPIKTLVANAGQDASLIIRHIRQNNQPDFGYNVETGEFGALTKLGIIDPTKVTRLALRNAASVAELLLTTGAAVTEEPDEENEEIPEE